MTNPIRIGLAGTGFGRRVMLPGFAACEGVEFTAVCSATEVNAQDTANEFNIPNVFTDYEAMLDQVELDLILITTPPNFHLPMVKSAAEKNIHILCEKPTALNVAEARSMLESANSAGVHHWIDHELRFHPTFKQMKSYIKDGFLGNPETISFSMLSNAGMVLNRPWNWWFDENAGGGMLGAIGSHQTDLVRWLLDTEFAKVQGAVKNFLPPQPDVKTQELKPVTSDNYAQYLCELENGAVGSILLDATARQTQGWRSRMEYHGDKGSLIYDEDARLWALNADGKEDITPTDPLKGTIAPEGMFPEAFVHFSREIVGALQQGMPVEEAATFEDGVQIQAVLDAVRLSSKQGGWIEPAKL